MRRAGRDNVTAVRIIKKGILDNANDADNTVRPTVDGQKYNILISHIIIIIIIREYARSEV